MLDVKLTSLVGAWTGIVRTWLEPGKLEDESPVEGRFVPILGDRFLRHTYAGAIRGSSRHGEETIARNAITRKFQVVWFDEFHMNYALMLSEGEETADGFVVTGHYDAAPNAPRWGWKTAYRLEGAEHLTITAFNITPDGEETKAVETVYVRHEP